MKKLLKKYEGKISDKERKEILKFLIDNPFGISKEVIEQIKNKLSKIK